MLLRDVVMPLWEDLWMNEWISTRTQSKCWYAGHFHYFIHTDTHAARNNHTEKSLHIGQEFKRRNTQPSPPTLPLLSAIPGNSRKKKHHTNIPNILHLYELARKSSHHHSHYDHRMQDLLLFLSVAQICGSMRIIRIFELYYGMIMMYRWGATRNRVPNYCCSVTVTLCRISNWSGECRSAKLCVISLGKKLFEFVATDKLCGSAIVCRRTMTTKMLKCISGNKLLTTSRFFFFSIEELCFLFFFGIFNDFRKTEFSWFLFG